MSLPERNQTSCIKDDDENWIEMYDLDLLQDIYVGFCQRISATIDWRRRCPLAKCYQPWALHRTGHTVRKKTKQTKNRTPIIPPISRHTVDTHMLVHTQTHMHAQPRMLIHLTHTSTHCIENHMCVCVWSCGLVLYVWMCNQTSPLLRASSLSCRGNVTQMHAGEENNKK